MCLVNSNLPLITSPEPIQDHRKAMCFVCKFFVFVNICQCSIWGVSAEPPVIYHMNSTEASKMAANQETAAENTAKTIVLVGHGGLDKLKIQQKERPKPGQGEVLVNVKATGINFAELMARQGMLQCCNVHFAKFFAG